MDGASDARSQGQGFPTLTPIDMSFQYHYQPNNSYTDSTSSGQDQQYTNTNAGGMQYDSNNFGQWNNNNNGGDSLQGLGDGMMDQNRQMPGRSNGMNGGFPQGNQMQNENWQGGVGEVMRLGSQDLQLNMPLMQNGYNLGGDFNNSQNGGNNMVIGLGQRDSMNMNGGRFGNNNNVNRFASSQMSQMGGGSRSSASSPLATGGSNAQGRALNKMLLEILRDRMVDPNRLAMVIEANIERMDCVNLATLLFHTGKKRLLLTPSFIKRIACRFNLLKEELRAREASNALYGLKCMSSECAEVRQLILALANKVAGSNTELVAQAVGNTLYGCQMMTSDHEEVRYLLQVLSVKVNQCTELLEAQNVGNALYGLRGMGSDYKEVRAIIAALTPKVASAREDLNGQALGNSLYGLQGMSSREQEVRTLLTVLAQKVIHTTEALKAQEVGNALYGLKRMSSDVLEVRQLIDALVPKVANSSEILDAQAIGNSFYGMQNMHADNPAVLSLLATMADKVSLSGAELDGQAMGNSLYGLQGMSSEHAEVRAVINVITTKIQSSCLEMNAQELGNALYGLQDMTSAYPEVRRLMTALSQKVASSKHELTSQEIGNALFGLQGMRANVWETRVLVLQMAVKIQLSHSLIDPQGISNSLYGIQRMTSDCEDVRMLVQALAAKIELSWKLLSAQHLANCMFGLQGLSSAESEVRALVHALVPKILACRDELSAKQISHALYGLQNLSSEHEEVLPLIGALTEKLTLCTETIPIRSLGALMYGLQGMENSSQEVKQLVSAVGMKLSAADEVDSTSLGNCLFSLQRMDNSASEVCSLLNIIDSLLAAIVDSGLDLSPLVCANTLYGLQNCSIADESTRRIIYLVVNSYSIYFIAKSKSSLPPSTLIHRVKEMLLVQSTSTSVRQGPLGRFSDLLGLYQALSLVVPMQPDLEIDTELQMELLSVQAAVAQLVSARSDEFKPVPLSATEARLVAGITDLLANEPFDVTHSVLLHGFTACVVVRLKEGIHLQTSTGELWNPLLVIEPSGGANVSFPRRQLFTRLKHEFFQHAHGLQLQLVPVTALMGEGRGLLRERLLELPDLVHALYPPTLEDSANFASILSAIGMTGPNGLMSSIADNSRSRGSPHSNSANRGEGHTAGSSFFSGGTNAFSGESSDEPCDGSLECCLDFHETAPYTTAQRSMLANSTMQQGMAVRWIGDAPVVVSISPSPHPMTSPLNRSPAVLPSPAGISVMPATNTNSSNKYTPTLTSTTGIPLTQYPTVHLRNSPFRQLQGQGQGQGRGGGSNGSKMASPVRTGSHSPNNGPGGMGNGSTLDKRVLSERLQAVAAYSSTEGNQRMGNNSGNSYEGSYGPDDGGMRISPKGTSTERSQTGQTGVDKEIEELEAELEIARLEAKILKLRNAKGKAPKVVSAPMASQYSNQDPEGEHTGADDVGTLTTSSAGSVYNDNQDTDSGGEFGSPVDATI